MTVFFNIAHTLGHGWASTPARLVIAFVVTLAFALVAHLLQGANRSGAVAGGMACFLLFVGTGPAGFLALAALFLMTWASTRLGYQRKLALGVAERREGRSAKQILANLAIASLASIAFSATGNRAWLVATLAALAEAAADTVASEVGQHRGAQARLITTWQPVPAGTDGGITLVGSIAAAAAGLTIAIVGAIGGALPLSHLWIPAAAGFLGMLIDSALGATLQHRGWMSNEAVNFLSTLTAAILAFGVAP